LGKIAYTIEGAAAAASVSEAVIIDAVKANQLIARRIDTDKAVIMHRDIETWLGTLPNFRETI